MEQATEPTTPTASPATDTFAHAYTVAGTVIALLTPDQMPFALETEEDFPSGWRVHLKFRQSRAEGLMAFAALVGVPVTRALTEVGVFLEAIVRVEDIEVRGSALVSPDISAQLEGEPTPIESTQEPVPPAAAPVPLGASVLAQAAVVTPVAAPDGDQ